MTASTAQPKPETPIPVQLLINTQYIKDFSFENPHAPQSLQIQAQPKITVNVQVQARPVGENVFETILAIKTEGRLAETPAFIVELAYGAICTLQANLSQDTVRPLLMVEAPRLMFPFARAIIAEAVRSGGYGPLLLNPVDFAEMYRRQILSEKAGMQGSPPQDIAGTA